jgi:hypothetical protein
MSIRHFAVFLQHPQRQVRRAKRSKWSLDREKYAGFLPMETRETLGVMWRAVNLGRDQMAL